MNARNALAIGIAVGAMTVCSASAQIPKRPISGGGSFGPSGIEVVPSTPKTITKKVTYLALSKKRQWLSRDGKSILGTLLAFDEGNEATFVAPTVIKDDKIRLIKDNKEFVLPLERLKPEHQDDVLEIETRIKATYAAKKAAAAKAAAGGS